MTIFNTINNVSEDYLYIISEDEIFYDKASLPTDIFVYDDSNSQWETISTSDNDFDTTYAMIKEAIISASSDSLSKPQILDLDEDFESLLNSDEIVSKKIIVANVSEESTTNYQVIIAKENIINEITIDDGIINVSLNSGYNISDYYQQTINASGYVTFGDIPKGDYIIYIITANSENPSDIIYDTCYESNFTIPFEDNLKIKIYLDTDSQATDNLILRQMQQVSPLYLGINTLNQSNFPDFNFPIDLVHDGIKKYFAVILDDNIIGAIPIKSLLLLINAKIEDMSSYTASKNEYLSAVQTKNLINEALDAIELFDTSVASYANLLQLSNPQTNHIYLIKKAADNSDGLNITFDLYAFNPSYTSNDDKFYKLDDLNINFVYPAVDIVDNLTTNDNTKALSAKQGKVLYDLIEDIQDFIHS